MSDMIERVARAMTSTLRHHGVEMHPDDIKGLAWDAIDAMRAPTDDMIAAADDVGEETAIDVWADMIVAAGARP